MRVLDLNLSTRPFRNNTVLWIGYGLIAALLALISVRHVQRYRENDVLLSDLRTQVANIDVQMAQLERRDRAARDGTRGFDVRSLTVQAAKANEVIRWKSFSWTRLFNELEALQPHDVRMTSVRPLFLADQRVPPGRAANVDSSAVPVAVEGAAKTLDDFLDLERELLRDPSFSRIEPERSARAESTGETLFQLRFVYDPAHSLAALTAGDLPAPTAPTAPNDDEPAAPEVEAPVDPSGSPANGSGDAADAARPRSEASATAPTAQLTEIRSQGRGRWPVATPSGETP